MLNTLFLKWNSPTNSVILGLLLDKVLAEQKLDAKNNCSSNMLKFFDFHKNLQNQVNN